MLVQRPANTMPAPCRRCGARSTVLDADEDGQAILCLLCGERREIADDARAMDRLTHADLHPKRGRRPKRA